MKALVLGGYGAVGVHVVTELRARGDVALAAGRDPRRADLVVDLRRPHTLDAALTGVDVVVNAAGTEDPALVDHVTSHGAAFVDVTATTGYVAALESSAPAAPVLLSAGLAPGLTNLLAAAVHEKAPHGPIDIALLLGSGERYGKASATWAYHLLGRRFDDPATGEEVRNYTRPRRFELPGHGLRRLYRTDYSDQHVLSRDLGVPVRTYFGLGSRLATGALATLTWIPGASTIPPTLHLPGDDRWLALARSRDGHTRWLTGRVQARATGVTAAIAARTAPHLPAGVHHLHQVMGLTDLHQARFD
ncbi:saccharopine dehydrogenase [Streptosporangium sp. KLBMP 9127]|nr:saccharopine dehydrogenase [Streptosporangium sp. KLBMP 9127]